MIVAALLTAAASSVAILGPIRAQLFYEAGATFSGDIAPPGKFAGWNTIIGEGPAKGPARDVLITVPLSAPSGARDARLTNLPLRLTARDGRGQLLAARTVSALVVPYRGSTWSALWLRDATCAGKVMVEARFGSQIRRTMLALDCGE